MIQFSEANIDNILSQWLEQQAYSQIFILCDTNTYQYCLPILPQTAIKARLIVIEAGEQQKNIETCTKIWAELSQANTDRKALLINLGGGVIGDMGGFSAATFKRGIDFLQIPTTLLSQVDASVGGKLAVDFLGYKNQIGLFKEPKAVFIDSVFLQTLPEREIMSGYAEILKHSLIADLEQWHSLQKIDKITDITNWQNLIVHSVSIKENIVKKDPQEQGERKLLNFGHTIGHAIETYFLQSETYLLHGEAIAWGMYAESWLSWQKGFLSEQDFEQIAAYIKKHYAYTKPKLDEKSICEVIEIAKQDKKNENNTFLFTLLHSLGKGIINIKVSENELKASLNLMKA
ncbi:MAG: 3-dehydroquinate synthase [Thermonemataceae bacterium]|nr:3-dehydroquinate synthase [Thermonemataceae bacterium]